MKVVNVMGVSVVIQMSKCKNCNCICHCSLEEHSDAYGVCPCQACACSHEDNGGAVEGGVVMDNTEDCESCQ